MKTLGCLCFLILAAVLVLRGCDVGKPKPSEDGTAPDQVRVPEQTAPPPVRLPAEQSVRPVSNSPHAAELATDLYRRIKRMNASGGRDTQPAEVVNSLGMRLVLIPAGSFTMGGEGEICPNVVAPPHKVRITWPFYMARHEVTTGQFLTFIRQAPRPDLLTPDFKACNAGGDTQAVCHVSWQDARDFISWLNRREPGRHYRLPTEAEWEYAARAGTRTAYSWGDDPRQAKLHAWFRVEGQANGLSGPQPVGELRPNPWGLFDMHGNVWEWVADWYGPYGGGPASDPEGPPQGTTKVNRGGSWNHSITYLRSACRNYTLPQTRSSVHGFRVVMDP